MSQDTEKTKKKKHPGTLLPAPTTSLHKYIADISNYPHLQKVVLVGKEFGKVHDKIDCVHFATTDEAKEWFSRQHFENTTFLLKGSRGIALEKIVS